MKLILYIIACIIVIQFFKLSFEELGPIEKNIELDWPIYRSPPPPIKKKQQQQKTLSSKKKEKFAPRKRSNFLYSLI